MASFSCINQFILYAVLQKGFAGVLQKKYSEAINSTEAKAPVKFYRCVRITYVV